MHKHIPHPLFYLCLLTLLGIAGCEGCNEGPDHIYFENEGSDMIGLMIDGADADGDFTDETILIPGTSAYDFTINLLPRDDGNEEIAAFTRGRPPYVINPTIFREQRNVDRVPFGDEMAFDFTIWVLDTGAGANGFTNRVNETIDGLMFCEERWLEERMGIRIGDIRIFDERHDSDADDLRDHELDTDNSVYFPALASEIGYDAGRINIYLIRKVGGSRRYGATLLGQDQIIMGMWSGSVDLLFHEIGHDFTLDHIDDDSNFNSKNAMKSTGNVFTRRLYMTEGQTYRSHTHSQSAINDTYNARPGAYTVDCGHDEATVFCPRIEKRIWSDGNAFSAN